MRPIIGITSELGTNRLGQQQSSLNVAYSRAIAEAGATPVVIPLDLGPDACASLVASLDGILLSGGGDVEPWRYHGDAEAPLVEVNAARDAVEFELVRLAVESGRPLLGICRGCQVINVALGGTLYEDLATTPATAVEHNVPGKESGVPAHEVSVVSGSALVDTLRRASFGVNSHHHQGIRELGAGLRVSARAPDGLIEAVELTGHPFGLAVQWHPEWLTHQEWTRKLFAAFVQASTRGR